LSYEDQSNNFVYFDDYKVTYTPTNIVQYNEYYPYGLVTNNSWTKENAVGNNFLGNGGTELNTTSGLYDLEYRNYDPALARMHQVDPMADKYASFTPYNYSFNAPSNFNDVNGADPSPGEKDHVTRRGNQILRPGITGGNDFSRIFRGGSQYGMFNAGWSPNSNSMTQVGGMTGEQYSQMHEDARAVKNNTMSPQEYGFKYGDKNYWMSYREKENSDGSISGGFYLYNDQSYWKDEPNDFSSMRIPLAFAVYKNGAGSEYWGGKASNDAQETDPRVMALIAGTGFFLNATQTMTDYTLAFPKPMYYGPKEWQTLQASGKAFTRGLGIIGLVVTGADIATSKQLKSSHILDATFGLIGFVPGGGSIIAGTYFLANTITILSTGKSIGDHLDNYLDKLAVENANR
jgi:RHS repeat-associated protein